MSKTKKKPKPKSSVYRVKVITTVTLKLSDELLPNDDWRKQFYGNVRTMQDVANHIAYNVAANGVTRLSQLDGWADKPASAMDVVNVESEVDD